MTEQINELNRQLDAILERGKAIEDHSKEQLKEVWRLQSQLIIAWKLQHTYRQLELGELKETVVELKETIGFVMLMG